MIGVTAIVVDQDCDTCGFFATILVGVATIVVDCDNCDHIKVSVI